MLQIGKQIGIESAKGTKKGWDKEKADKGACVLHSKANKAWFVESWSIYKEKDGQKAKFSAWCLEGFKPHKNVMI